MKEIENLLRERIGLDPGSVGATLIHRQVRQRLKTLGLPNLNTYKALLTESATEWRELTEAVVVAETWFFRDPGSFDAVVRLAKDEWLRAAPDQPFRILSLPCSTGEEPYSLAMALLDAGIPPSRFRIDAVDLSWRAIERARAAVYGPNSFRGTSLGFRDRHFRSDGESYVLDASVRGCVQFKPGNVLDKHILGPGPAYECIFCRNLLIYFNRPTQKVALRLVRGLLKPRGVLFVGSAELPLLEGHGFLPTDNPLAIACRKSEENAGQGEELASPPPVATLNSQLLQFHQPPVRHSAFGEGGSTLNSQLSTLNYLQAGTTESALVLARRFIESGRLAEATVICEEALRKSRMCAQAYFLLGYLKDAAGDKEAADYYRRALYLQPDHHESLLRMAGLAARLGQPDRALAYQRRARKAKQRVPLKS